MRYMDLMGGRKPHLLSKTVNNLGAQTRVQYSPSTKFFLQDKANGKPWITKLPFPVHVVERVETIDDVMHPGIPADKRAAGAAGFKASWSQKTDAEREQWGAGQGYIALGYLLLASSSLGYATSPMLGFDPAKVKEVLGLPSHVSIPALVSIGRGDEEGFTHHRHAVERLVTYR